VHRGKGGDLFQQLPLNIERISSSRHTEFAEKQ